MPQKFGIFRALRCLVALRYTKHCNARKNPNFWGMRCTKQCNAWKIPKIPNFCKLCRLEGHRSRNFGIFGILRALLCLVYLRATKHRKGCKIPKFWGMRCTNHCTARKIPKIPKIPKHCDLWPSSLHSLQTFGIFGIFQALQCLVHLMPQKFGIFRALRFLDASLLPRSKPEKRKTMDRGGVVSIYIYTYIYIYAAGAFMYNTAVFLFGSAVGPKVWSENNSSSNKS